MYNSEPDAPRRKAEEGIREKHKNSGNEAKKYLKTKDNRFLKAANCARFAHRVAQSSALKEQEQNILATLSAPKGRPNTAQANGP